MQAPFSLPAPLAQRTAPSEPDGAPSGSGAALGSGTGGSFGNGRFVGDAPGALEARIGFIPETTRSLKETQTGTSRWIITGTFSASEVGNSRSRLDADDGGLHR